MQLYEHRHQRFLKPAILLILVVFLSVLTGCGVSKNKYEALLNEKIALEEKLDLITKSRDALRTEYENLLKEKIDLSAKLETETNEKNALRSEYNRLLDEKVALKASYNKIASGQETKAQQTRAAKR